MFQTHILDRLTGDELIPIVAILSTFAFLIVYAIANNWRKARVKELEIALKRELISQGRTAEEIERIVQANHDAKKDSKS